MAHLVVKLFGGYRDPFTEQAFEKEKAQGGKKEPGIAVMINL